MKEARAHGVWKLYTAHSSGQTGIASVDRIEHVCQMSLRASFLPTDVSQLDSRLINSPPHIGVSPWASIFQVIMVSEAENGVLLPWKKVACCCRWQEEIQNFQL